MNGPDHEDWENDPVWNLVDEAKSPEAGPFFVRNVMREVRLSEESPARWWQRFLSPKPLLAGALGAAAAVVILVNLNTGEANDPGLAAPADPKPASGMAAASKIDELLEEEMLFAAAENPAAFTDEALLDLLD